MALPTNILQTVQTYQDSGLAFLINSFFFINKANKKFKDFENREANLGDTVGFDLPPRYTTTNTLVATFQPSTQRIDTLTVDNAVNTAYAFSAQQFIFNVRDYMEKFGKAAVMEIGTQVEADVAKVCETSTFRFYGDGVTQINSYNQLAEALAYFRNFGAAKDNTRGILPDVAVPAIVGSGLNQFVMGRNNEIANSWELGRFSMTEWYQSNLLPVHTSGTDAQDQTVLTLVSTNDPTGQAVTQLTFSGTHTASDVNSVKAYDLFQFQDGVANEANLRYLTFIGHKISANPVQFAATADAASTSGSQVTINIMPPLVWAQTAQQNLNVALQAGMQVIGVPSHRCGLIYSGDALYLAMPRLPEEIPFPTSNKADPESGCSMRMYYGSLFGQNQRGFVHDVIWGKTLVPEYSMRLCFPL